MIAIMNELDWMMPFLRLQNLTTKELGRLVVYTDVITSTMNVIHGHFLRHGLVVIAARQTSGKGIYLYYFSKIQVVSFLHNLPSPLTFLGRSRNVWLSPEGCAMFSLQLAVDLDSPLGRRISLIQHIAGLAVVLSIPNYKVFHAPRSKLCQITNLPIS